MNILIITGIFPPDIGGPASYVPAIARALDMRGHRVSVITLSDRTGKDKDDYPPDNFPVLRIARRMTRPLRFCKTVVSICKQGREADILFVNGLALESVVANWFLKKPLVQKTVGDLVWERARTRYQTRDSLEEFQKRRYGIRIQLLKGLRSFWAKQSDVVIVPSMYLKRIVQCWGVREKNIEVIYNAIQEDSLPLESIAMPELLKTIPGERKKILSTGRLLPWKGFDTLITVMGAIPEAHLVIIGDGVERQNLVSLVQRSSLTHRVHFTGLLTREEVFAFLKYADLFVLNSTYEGLPHILLEAMKAQIPIIATDIGGTPELIKDHYNGILVPPSEPSTLKKAICNLLNDEPLRKRVIAGGKETLEHFHWQKLVEKTEAVLEAMVKQCR